MDSQAGAAAGGQSELQKQREMSRSLVDWYKKESRHFLAAHAPDQISPLDNDVRRIEKLLAAPDSVTACFLGHSGIGKSTLLNALAAGRDYILPSGGIGPLTALATEVTFSPSAKFIVKYHKRARLWRLVFALQRYHEISSGDKYDASTSRIPETDFDDDARQDVQVELDAAVADGNTNTRLSGYVNVAQHIVTGSQFEKRTLPYLIDALRAACGQESRFETELSADDLERIERIKAALVLAESGTPHQRQAEVGSALVSDLRDHAAGFLAPLVEEIHIGWPSALLKAGVTLVDLPGVGISGDTYRQVTQKYIRNDASAVILTVDRSGPTADSVDLLKASGYWDRLVGASDDPASDPCKLFIAVTKVDDIADADFLNWPIDAGPRPPKREIYGSLVNKFKSHMRAQITEQLETISGSDNESVELARAKARQTILADLKVFPVSAPEYRKLLLEDEDERPFLHSEDQTGIPDLLESLTAVAIEQRSVLLKEIKTASDRLRETLSAEVKRIETLWRDRARVAIITEALEAEFQTFLVEKSKERDLRVGMFREYLEATSQTQIKQLVTEARESAETEVRKFLRTLQNAHWATLKATVTRGGAFVGNRAINLPEQIAQEFQEPMAAVWSTKLLTGIRKRTGEWADDQAVLVEEICDWADSKTQNAGLVNVLNGQRKSIRRRAEQMRQVGKEAIGDLREVVKNRVSEAVRKPIKAACEKFVKQGDHYGPGVKSRILRLFSELAQETTKAAEAPAKRILEDNFSKVRGEIKSAFEDWGDPLQQTVNLILQREKQEIDQRSDREREEILRNIDDLLSAPHFFPDVVS